MMRTFRFSTKQKGYGRQGVYVIFQKEKYYIQDVFPNVSEHFSDFELLEDCFYDEEKETYIDCNGREVTPIDSWDEFLTENLMTEIGRVLFENCAFDNIELGGFDLDDATYEEIAQWALEYEFRH